MATETEKLVYIIEVQDNGSAVFKDFSANIKGLENFAIASFKKIGEKTVELVADTVRAFSKYEDALSGARRTMQLNAEETDALGKSLQGLALDFSDNGLQAGIAADELAKIAGIAGQMNFSFKKDSAALMEFTKTVAMVSTAFEMSAESTASSLGILSTVFNVPIEKTKEMAGAIAILANTSVASVPQLLDFMTRVGPVFSELGGTAEQAAAIGATLRDSGISMEVAGTALTQVFSKMQTDYAKFEEVLAGGGISKGMIEMALRSGDALGALQLVAGAIDRIAAVDKLAATQAMKDLGFSGYRVVTAMQALVSELPKLNENLAAVNDPIKNAQAINDAYGASIDTLTKRWEATKNMIDIVAKIIGKELANALEIVLEKYINPFLERITKWAKESPVLQSILQEIGRLIVSIGTALDPVLQKFATWLETMDSEKAGVQIKNFFFNLENGVSSFLKQIVNKDWAGFWTDLKTNLQDLFAELGRVDWKSAWVELKYAVQIVYDTIVMSKDTSREWLGYLQDYAAGAAAGIDAIVEAIKKTSQGLGYMIDRGGAAFDKWMSGMAKAIDDFMASLLRVFQPTEDLGNLFDKVFDTAISWVGKLGKALLNELTFGALDKVIGKLKEVGEVSHGESVFPDMAKWAGVAAQAVGGITEQASTLSTALSALPAWAQTSGTTWQDAAGRALFERQQTIADFGQAGGFETAARRDALLAGASPQWFTPEILPPPVTTGGTPPTVTINFSGQNLASDKALMDFAGQIQKVIMEQKGTSINVR